VSSNRKTVIIGGGISGLTAAHYCIGEAVVIEAEAQLGGVLRTEYREGCVVEQGADAWLTSKPWAAELAREVGLGDQLTGSNDAARRTFIWKKGEAVAFPEGMQLVAPTSAMPILRSKLLSPYTKLRMALDWLPTFKPGRMAERERTVGAMVADHFGMEAVDYIAEPLLSGIYGGDPFELSATSVLPKLVERERKTGSLIRGAKLEQREGALFTTIRDGLERRVPRARGRRLDRGGARGNRLRDAPGGHADAGAGVIEAFPAQLGVSGEFGIPAGRCGASVKWVWVADPEVRTAEDDGVHMDEHEVSAPGGGGEGAAAVLLQRREIRR
jgi:protoporphyrinogen oxidase